MQKTIIIGNTEIRFLDTKNEDYLCLTDMIKLQNDLDLKEYFRLANTISFLLVWEMKYNSDFDLDAFNDYRAGKLPSRLRISPQQWIKEFNGESLILKKGRFGGVYAHRIVAIHFANWLSTEFYVDFVATYIEMAENRNKKYLQFMLQKIEDNSLENGRLAKDYNERFLSGEDKE